MPALLAGIVLLLRPVIQFAVTWISIEVLMRTIVPQLDKLIVDIQVRFGVDPQTAQDIAANEYLKMAESIGIGALLIKSRTPNIIADKLGFTTKGFAKRKLPATAEAKVSAAKATSATASAAQAEVLQQGAATIAVSKGAAVSVVFSASQKIVGALGGLVGLGLLITNTIDFGAWSSSAYQGTFQKFLALFGLNPDRPTTTPRTVSQEVYLKVYTALKNEGAYQINNPFTGETVPYTEPNFAAVVDKLASHIFIESGTVSAKQLLAASLAVTVIRGGSAVKPPASTSTTTPPKTTAPVTTTKVFTGVVSQGTLGSSTSFTPRPDDLITSVQDLTNTAANNLAPFIASLAGRLIYEIKIVSSVMTASGFTQRGTTQQIQIGTYTDGRPKYKTVTNRFAVMNLYILNKSGSRSSLSQIILGPTDAAAFKPTAAEIANAQDTLRGTVQTSDVSDITGVVASNGTVSSVTPPATQEATQPSQQNPLAGLVVVPRDYFIEKDGYFGRVYYRENGRQFLAVPSEDLIAEGAMERVVGAGNQWEMARQILLRAGIDVASFRREEYASEYPLGKVAANELLPFRTFFGGSAAPAAPTATSTLSAAARSAQTLYDFYTAQGKALPSLSERAALYASLALGAASYYVGSSDQNTKLLMTLKAQG